MVFQEMQKLVTMPGLPLMLKRIIMVHRITLANIGDDELGGNQHYKQILVYLCKCLMVSSDWMLTFTKN